MSRYEQVSSYHYVRGLDGHEKALTVSIIVEPTSSPLAKFLSNIMFSFKCYTQSDVLWHVQQHFAIRECILTCQGIRTGVVSRIVCIRCRIESMDGGHAVEIWKHKDGLARVHWRVNTHEFQVQVEHIHNVAAVQELVFPKGDHH